MYNTSVWPTYNRPVLWGNAMYKRPKDATHFIFIEWDDAVGDASAGDGNLPLYRKITCGFLLKEDKDGFVVGQEYNEDGTYENRVRIPMGMIVNTIRRKLPWKVK